MDWKTKYAAMSEADKTELANDIAFAIAVNNVAVSTHGQLLAAANAEPFRQFIVERYILDNGAFVSDEHWFLDEGRERFAKKIRETRKLYEAAEDEKGAVVQQTNAVLAQLQTLEQKIASLQASDTQAAADTPAEPQAPADAPAEEKPDAEDEDDEDEASED